jgi:hypothetical protein
VPSLECALVGGQELVRASTGKSANKQVADLLLSADDPWILESFFLLKTC